MFESGERRITVPATKDFALTYIGEYLGSRLRYLISLHKTELRVVSVTP